MTFSSTCKFPSPNTPPSLPSSPPSSPPPPPPSPPSIQTMPQLAGCPVSVSVYSCEGGQKWCPVGEEHSWVSAQRPAWVWTDGCIPHGTCSRGKKVDHCCRLHETVQVFRLTLTLTHSHSHTHTHTHQVWPLLPPVQKASFPQSRSTLLSETVQLTQTGKHIS